MYRKLIITKLAALGVLVKAGAAGAAVVVATAGVGAAGALPGPTQAAFDKVTQQEEPEVETPVEDLQLLEETEDDTDSDGNGPPADSFGERVSQDARGEDDVPGVDGREISAEASEGRSEEARNNAEQRREERGEGVSDLDDLSDDELTPEDDSDGSDDDSDGEGRPEGAGESNAPFEVPPVETPAGGPDTADQS